MEIIRKGVRRQGIMQKKSAICKSLMPVPERIQRVHVKVQNYKKKATTIKHEFVKGRNVVEILRMMRKQLPGVMACLRGGYKFCRYYILDMLNLFGQHTLVEGDFSLKDIRVLQEIGRGNSHVYKILLRDSIFALKQIQIKNDYEYQSFLKEIYNMQKLSEVSNYMIKYFGYFVTLQEPNQYSKRKYAHIIMECAEMNLQDLIAYRSSNSCFFSKAQILHITGFLLQAFVDLEKNKIAHCDIKPENILVLNSQTLAMKLCDVGSCHYVNSEYIEEATIFGTVPFLAPELIKMKSKKIISSNPFKSDVYSLGLVLLYAITCKKFSSKERIQIVEEAYFEIILEWIKEARELTNYDSRISEVLKHSLEFQEFKRPLFTGVKGIYDSERKKKKANLEQRRRKLQLQENERISKQTLENFHSAATNKISLFKSRNLTTKISNRTTRLGFPKIRQRKDNQSPSPSPSNYSPSSPLSKRQSSCFSSTSPGNNINSTLLDYKKIIYVTEEDKDTIPYEYMQTEEKNFILFTSYVGFKTADMISIFSPCSLQAIYELADVQANKLYLQYAGVEGIGVAEDVPTLKIRKIYADLSETSLVGGYKYLFGAFCSDFLQYLELKLTGSEASLHELIDLLDRLALKNIKYFGLTWQSLILTSEDHSLIIEKISRLPLKRLNLKMSNNFIKYEKQSRWLLPKTCEILNLQYDNNFIGKILSNLSLSISKCPIKELHLNVTNNNIDKGEANTIFKTVASLPQLEKLVLNLSWNCIEDVSYMLTELQKLKGVTALQLKLQHCSIDEQKILDMISEMKELFEQKMKIFKIGYQRTMRKHELEGKIEQILQPMKNLKVDIIGKDNKYFNVYIKKKEKSTKTKSTANTNRLKGQKMSLGYKSVAPDEKLPKPSKAGYCQAFICSNESYENYLCLACCDLRQMSKNEYFCKYCIENCGHKGHNFVRVYQKTRCQCAYSGMCNTEISKKVCAQMLKIQKKEQHECLKCQKLFCNSCASKCKEMHPDWVGESKEVLFFTCGTPL